MKHQSRYQHASGWDARGGHGEAEGLLFCVVKSTCFRFLFALLVEFKLAGRTGPPHRERGQPIYFTHLLRYMLICFVYWQESWERLQVCSNLITYSPAIVDGKLRWAAKINAIRSALALSPSEWDYLQDAVGFIYVCQSVYMHVCLCMSTEPIPRIIGLAFTVNLMFRRRRFWGKLLQPTQSRAFAQAPVVRKGEFNSTLFPLETFT